jgi:hypothetical protein
VVLSHASLQEGGLDPEGELVRDPALLLIAPTQEIATSPGLAGLDIAFVPRRASVTFAHRRLPAAVETLMMPWRWRRLLLNEGVTSTEVPLELASAPIAVAAFMAGTKVRLRRERTRRNGS